MALAARKQKKKTKQVCVAKITTGKQREKIERTTIGTDCLFFEFQNCLEYYYFCFGERTNKQSTNPQNSVVKRARKQLDLLNAFQAGRQIGNGYFRNTGR